jgi:2-oxoglutarate dehydrogenase E2 component (dihydrolipoamide succinyltransferase)
VSVTAVEVRVPRMAESVSEAVIVEWLKPDGAAVRTDEPIVTLETDKAAVELAASESGVLRHARQLGDTVVVNDVIARIEPGAVPAGAPASPPAPVPARPSAPAPEGAKPPASAIAGAEAPVSPPPDEPALGPAVRRLLEENGLSPSAVRGSGKGGRLLKEDVLRHLEEARGEAGAGRPAPPAAPAPAAEAQAAPAPPRAAPAAPALTAAPRAAFDGGERAVPMSRVRQRIAERLIQSQQTTATLTTFNEIDMSAVIEARARWKEGFEQRHGVRLGYMSFFARACVLALQEIPELNAEIRGTDIVYHDYVHLGIAVQTGRGLIVPVVRDAHRLGFAEIEREIARLAQAARDNKLMLEELMGGTFTISNGGVYGSLLATPILNPPQSGILGMHKIEKRPIARDDQVVIRPMMYVALSYDHRIVDGEQSVTFLVRVKERLEDPERMLLDV